MKTLLSSPERKYKFFLLALFAVISFMHLFRLGSVPAGLYWDETSIGLNAATLSQAGVDENGYQHPIFFTAFGENKNPVYIYVTAFIFKLFGVSDFYTRFASFIFFISGLILSFLLIRHIFPGQKLVWVFFVISLGFLPQLFTVSRLSFEAISQFTFISGALLFVWKTFDGPSEKRSRVFALVCGLLLGLSVYTYSTARLLSFLLLGSLWFIYIRREDFFRLVLITVAFLSALIPYAYYFLKYPTALTARFDNISYLSSDLSVPDKISSFFTQYFLYFSPDFLILKGDPNLRHSIGAGGIIFSVILLVFLFSLFILVKNRKLLINRFVLFLIVNLALSPVAAALTNVSTPHVLRSLLLGYLISIISCFGLSFITNLKSPRIRQGLILGISLWLIAEIIVYLGYYFIIYPVKSMSAMDGFGIGELMQRAIDENPQELIFSEMSPEYYATERYYSFIINNPRNIRLGQSASVEAKPGTCYLFPREKKTEMTDSGIFVEFESRYRLNALEVFFQVKELDPLYLVRCYK